LCVVPQLGASGKLVGTWSTTHLNGKPQTRLSRMTEQNTNVHASAPPSIGGSATASSCLVCSEIKLCTRGHAAALNSFGKFPASAPAFKSPGAGPGPSPPSTSSIESSIIPSVVNQKTVNPQKMLFFLPPSTRGSFKLRPHFTSIGPSIDKEYCKDQSTVFRPTSRTLSPAKPTERRPAGREGTMPHCLG
jgi:hypothetical protein